MRTKAELAPGVLEQAASLWEAGATNKEVAEALGIPVQRLSSLLARHEDLRLASRLSRDKVRVRLEARLVELCQGSTRVEETQADDGDGVFKTVSRKVTHLPPDAKDIMAWLQGRFPERWRKTQEVEVKVDRSLVDALNRGRERLAALDDDAGAA